MLREGAGGTSNDEPEEAEEEAASPEPEISTAITLDELVQAGVNKAISCKLNTEPILALKERILKDRIKGTSENLA